MADPCSLPLVGTVCGAVGDAAGSAAGSVFDTAVGKIADGFATAIQLVITFWTRVDVPGLSTSEGPVAELRANTAWLSAFIAVLSILICAGRMAMTRSSRPAAEAFKGLAILVVVSGAGVAAVNALVIFGDGYSRWVLDRSTDGQLGERLAVLATVGDTAGLGAGLILIIALLGMMASIAQVGLMLVRIGVVTIFAGLLPLAAAGTSTQTGMDFFKRLTSWLLAFVLYKPAAASGRSPAKIVTTPTRTSIRPICAIEASIPNSATIRIRPLPRPATLPTVARTARRSPSWPSVLRSSTHLE